MAVWLIVALDDDDVDPELARRKVEEAINQTGGCPRGSVEILEDTIYTVKSRA